ncbi:MAG: hypothetical protein R2699_13270 [Acidimicrobiales bacterium]
MRQQLGGVEGLGDRSRRRHIDAADLLGLGVGGGEHDDRHLREAADPFQHLGAVDVGQAEVQHDEVRADRPPRPRRTFTGGGLDHVVSTGGEAGAQARRSGGSSSMIKMWAIAVNSPRRAGQPDHERSATAVGRFHAQLTPLRFGQGSTDGESQAAAGHLTGVPTPFVLGEDPLAVVDGDARPWSITRTSIHGRPAVTSTSIGSSVPE